MCKSCFFQNCGTFCFDLYWNYHNFERNEIRVTVFLIERTLGTTPYVMFEWMQNILIGVFEKAQIYKSTLLFFWLRLAKSSLRRVGISYLQTQIPNAFSVERVSFGAHIKSHPWNKQTNTFIYFLLTFMPFEIVANKCRRRGVVVKNRGNLLTS